MSLQYVLLTAAKNEDAFIAATIESVLAQVHPPVEWVICSDGSTDRTDEIVQRYAETIPFLKLVRAGENRVRGFSSKATALATAAQGLRRQDMDFIGSLDADIVVQPGYYAELLARMHAMPDLGIGGGFIFERTRGVLKSRPFNSVDSVAGATQLFRKKCWDEVGGYKPMRHGGIDTLAEIEARMRGWGVRSFPDLIVEHLRPTDSAHGRGLRNSLRHGKRDAELGYHPIYELGVVVRRFSEPPWVVGPIARIVAYVHTCLTVKTDPKLRRFVRQYQRRRILKAIRMGSQ